MSDYYCPKCPLRSTGVFPKCECSNGEYFDGIYCVTCPSGSSGSHGNCSFECPTNSNETYPHCECNNGLFSIHTGQCVECPSHTTGY